MTITELRNKGLIPIIRTELYDNSTKHWWMVEDRRKNIERLYIGCNYPISSRKPFDTFADCEADLKETINSLNIENELNKQLNSFIDDNK